MWSAAPFKYSTVHLIPRWVGAGERHRPPGVFVTWALGFCSIYSSEIVKYQQDHIVWPNAYLVSTPQEPSEVDMIPSWWKTGPLCCAHPLSCPLKSVLSLAPFPDLVMHMLTCFPWSGYASLLNSCPLPLVYSTDMYWQTAMCWVCMKVANTLVE